MKIDCLSQRLRAQLRLTASSMLLLHILTVSCFAATYEVKNLVIEGNALYLNKDFSGAEIKYSEAIDEDPNWAMPYNNRGLARLKQGNFIEALSDFTKAIGLDATYVAPLLNRAKSYASQKQWTKAIADCNDGLGIDLNNPKLLYNLGWIYDELQQYEDANDFYTQALDADPNLYCARLARGITRAKQGYTQEAIVDFYGVINGAEQGDMLRNLAAYNLQHIRGDGIDFQSEQAAQNFIEGVFLYTTEQYDDAIVSLGEAEILESDIPEIPWMMYWALLSKGKTEAARSPYTRALALLELLMLDSIQPGANIFVDGIMLGTTPLVLFLFPSQYDLTLRREQTEFLQEWKGPSYTSGTTEQDISSMLLGLKNVTEFSSFGPVEDIDVDWLDDTWEEYWFGNLDISSTDDLTDEDLLVNLYEFWYGTDPTMADSDQDGISDFDEVYIYKSDPNLPNIFYYVNDPVQIGDLWCTVVGDNANDGRSPASPKATIDAVLSEYDLEPGSFVCVDSGYYVLSKDIEVAASNSGNDKACVVIQGSGSGTVLDRQSFEADNACIVLNGVEYVMVRSMQLLNSYCGIKLMDTKRCCVRECDLLNNSYSGLFSTGPNSIDVKNCLASGSKHGFYLDNRGALEAAKISNCTFANNTSNGIYGKLSTVSVRNCIFVASGEDSFCMSYGMEYKSGDLDHNCYYVHNGAQIARLERQKCPTLNSWQDVNSYDLHSIYADPFFAGPNDYHLQSTAGRYYNGKWEMDPRTSACVDRGYSYEVFNRETLPNGNRINLGRYGGTEEASRSRTEARITLVTPNSGEWLSGVAHINWVPSGAKWQVGDTVRLEYSWDEGATWIPIAQEIPFEKRVCVWDTRTAIPDSGPLFLIRITSNRDPSIFAQSDGTFYVYNTGTQYYVNDSSNEYDEWCTELGDDYNNGISPASPKATIQAILDTYNLEPGDVVRIDTGNYEPGDVVQINTGDYKLTSVIVVEAEDQGSSNKPVTFEMSPYGVTIDCELATEGSFCWTMFDVDYVVIRTAIGVKHRGIPKRLAKLTNALIGIYLQDTQNCTIERLEVTGNYWMGINLLQDSQTMCRNNVISRNLVYGIRLYGSDKSYLYNNTIVSNSGGAISFQSLDVVSVRLLNNIIWADGHGDFAIRFHEKGVPNYCISLSDFNCFYTTNGARATNFGDTLADWHQANGNDSSSINADPLFADPESGDYHLKSQTGRWDPNSESWIVDDVTSPCIDSGDPNSPMSSEPFPNGGIINMGAYGGTAEASKSPSVIDAKSRT